MDQLATYDGWTVLYEYFTFGKYKSFISSKFSDLHDIGMKKIDIQNKIFNHFVLKKNYFYI